MGRVFQAVSASRPVAGHADCSPAEQGRRDSIRHCIDENLADPDESPSPALATQAQRILAAKEALIRATGKTSDPTPHAGTPANGAWTDTHP